MGGSHDDGTAASRYQRAASRFDEVVHQVPEGAWSSPAPCAGWVARDVVLHLTQWVPGVLGSAGVEVPVPEPDADPVDAWERFHAALTAALADPEQAGRDFDAGPPGRMTVEQAVDALVAGDVLVHTWDLARATGQDEHLDAELAAGMLAGLEPLDEVLRASGHFGPRVAVPDDADVQTRLLAFTGRRP